MGTGNGVPELLDPPGFYPTIVRAQPFVVYQSKYDDGHLAASVEGYLVPQQLPLVNPRILCWLPSRVACCVHVFGAAYVRVEFGALYQWCYACLCVHACNTFFRAGVLVLPKPNTM